jgi:ubiquinone/menaquinone biosynthesis C-methylase UbiE
MRASLRAILNCFPRIKRLLQVVHERLLPGASVSSSYVPLQESETDAEGRRLRRAWQDDALPERQRALVEQQLLHYRRGGNVDVFDMLVHALRELPDIRPGMSFLEIGCSSGFYSEVLDISGLQFRYTGCDYSPAFIKLAREKYPTLEFAVEDATALHYPNHSFDIVVSGCCLLHIPEYSLAVAETSRVAASYAIFHRTPVVWGEPERWYRKQAYGVETVEIHFNEPEFLALLEEHNLELLATHTLHKEHSADDPTKGKALRTYVCRKIKP